MKILIGVDKVKDGFLKNNRETKRFFKNEFDRKNVKVKYDTKNRLKKASR